MRQFLRLLVADINCNAAIEEKYRDGRKDYPTVQKFSRTISFFKGFT